MIARKTIMAVLLAGVVFQATPVAAQELKISMKADSVFSPVEDEAKTFKGFDVDTSKVNVINIALQVAQDLAVANANSKEMLDVLPYNAYFRERADLLMSAALPEHTNIYSTISFVNTKEGTTNGATVVATNLEIEHFFKNHTKIRIGRLCNSVSESQFFGRIALEEANAHELGRKVYINDAIEWDGRFKADGKGVFFVGVKPIFMPLDFKGAYAGMHQPFENGTQMHFIVSANRMFETDIQTYLPEYTGGDDLYYSYEAEVAHKSKTTTVYFNAGGNIGSLGMIPHTSSVFDFLKQARPIVSNKEDAFKETFMASAGFRVYPARKAPKCKFGQIGLEAEVQGPLSDRFTALNVCGYCKVMLTRRLILTYYCTPRFIWQDINPNRPEFMGSVVNFARLSVTVGTPGRMFL